MPPWATACAVRGAPLLLAAMGSGVGLGYPASGPGTGGLAWAAEVVCARDGAGARCHAHSATTKASANTATIAPTPAVALNTLAQITPNRPRPSRQPTKRLRWASSPPNRAPQDWWAKPKVLRPTQHATKDAADTAIKPQAGAGVGKTQCGKNKNTKPTSNNTLHARAQANTRVLARANQPSVQRPSQGSMKASPKRATSSKAPIHDRGKA